MIAILVNGQVRETISVFDRGLAFGDGVFETLAVVDGQPCLWDEHMRRLQDGCRRLRLPFSDWDALRTETCQLLQGQRYAVLKIVITRGSSQRGYAIPEHTRPTRIVYRFPWHGPWLGERALHLRTCRQRLGQSTLAGVKHLNRLEQVLARAEWQDEFDECLMLDWEGYVIEGSMTNVFFQRDGQLHTPRLNRCGVAGIVRAQILEHAAERAVPVHEGDYRLTDILHAEAMYVCNALLGICKVAALDAHRWDFDVPWHPVLKRVNRSLFEPVSLC